MAHFICAARTVRGFHVPIPSRLMPVHDEIGRGIHRKSQGEAFIGHSYVTLEPGSSQKINFNVLKSLSDYMFCTEQSSWARQST